MEHITWWYSKNDNQQKELWNKYFPHLFFGLCDNGYIKQIWLNENNGGKQTIIIKANW